MARKRLSTPNTQSDLPPSDDPLADPLRLLKLTGVLHCAAELKAPWGLEIPRIEHCMAIHVVNRGRFYLDLAGQPEREVPEGSLVMIPHGTEHRLRSAPGVKVTHLTNVPVQLITERYERMAFGGSGEATNISYCGVRYDPLGAMRLLQVLPLVIQVDTRETKSEWLAETTRFISREADATRPGSEAIITRLADIIVVQAIRSWLENMEGSHGWLAALKDRQIGRALAMLHRDPCANWTVDKLAADVGMSRSSLSARFKALVGQSIIQYLTEWRLQLARNELMEGQTIGSLIEKYGYQSEASFSRAFKRIFEQSPSAMKNKLLDQA